jgi:hypothetical protein
MSQLNPKQRMDIIDSVLKKLEAARIKVVSCTWAADGNMLEVALEDESQKVAVNKIVSDVIMLQDNYCLKLLNGFGAGVTIGATTKQKFITELRKLHASGYCLQIDSGKCSITNTHAENLRRQTTDFDNFINAIFKPKKKILH